jgi:hypothetical protein
MGRNPMTEVGLWASRAGEKLCIKLWKKASKEGSWFLTWRNGGGYFVAEMEGCHGVLSI